MTILVVVASTIASLIAYWVFFAGLGRLVEGRWLWDWPLDLYRDLLGR